MTTTSPLVHQPRRNRWSSRCSILFNERDARQETANEIPVSTVDAAKPLKRQESVWGKSIWVYSSTQIDVPSGFSPALDKLTPVLVWI